MANMEVAYAIFIDFSFSAIIQILTIFQSDSLLASEAYLFE